jgi:hypothetical protein
MCRTDDAIEHRLDLCKRLRRDRVGDERVACSVEKCQVHFEVVRRIDGGELARVWHAMRRHFDYSMSLLGRYPRAATINACTYRGALSTRSSRPWERLCALAQQYTLPMHVDVRVCTALHAGVHAPWHARAQGAYSRIYSVHSDTGKCLT